jgi:alcohol dehydrogenase class IV
VELEDLDSLTIRFFDTLEEAMKKIVEAFTLPRWIEAEPGCIKNAGSWAAKFGKKAMVISGRGSARKFGLLDKIEKSLTGAGMAYEIFEEVEREPTLETIAKGTEIARASGCDVLIGVGGGSALDATKVIAMLCDNTGPAEDYQLDKRAWEAPGRPWIAIPTTAGTGSEATSVSVITNKRLGVKKRFFSWEMVSTVALLDAEASVNMPVAVTRESGLDALGQAIEGYLSTGNNPIIAAAAIRAVRLIHEFLPRAVENGNDIEARHNMLLAGLLGGVSIDTGVGLGHEMAMAVGSYKGISHGLLVGALTPWCLEPSLGYADRAMGELADVFGCTHDEPEIKARCLIQLVRDFQRKVGCPSNLGELGVSKEDISPILEASKLSTNIGTNPRPLDDAIRAAALGAAIDG